MNIKQAKNQIGQLKDELKAASRARDNRLIKLAFVMIILALVAAFMYGRIQLW
jgi:t-SNARE complex subunit (syntaxin)